ncbi:hypothetical protein M378DRAFT_114042 [Amanita muscaria Koide BX008]|uniref:DUF6535 domain-containing protein n=1 Tax=Amanita muscaria (strain Koide BX008) TaxID=946122 RepID=A0A0C2VZV7_AMAMK|nr:hypothetical protein M378DRAFT_114042 [Amanita muscaria Koide BX008]
MSTTPVPPVSVNRGSKTEKREHKLWRSDDPNYVETMPQGKGSPLDQIYTRMQQYDKGICKEWQDEIEHLLIFAGLFSATVTAFLVDSYKWLQQDRTDVSAQLLSQISLQLSAIANNSTPVPPSTILDEAFIPASQSIRVNIFWFTSLVLCLSTVIFGILCLQWLGEFARNISLSPADAITIRQMHYDGLERWKVPTIIDCLPVILQISVILFFAGLLDLLWSVHKTVATVVTVFVGLVTMGIIFTTAAPVIQTIIDFRHFTSVGNDTNACVIPCPYRSPLSSFALHIFMIKHRSWAEFDIFSHKGSMRPSHAKKTYNPKGLARALRWIMAKLSPELNQDIPQDVYHLLHDVIDCSTTRAVLLDWAELMGETRNLRNTLEDLRSSGMKQARYDLLMERLLRKTSPVQENRKLLLELQVRCINTLGDKKMADMGEVFLEVAHNCYYYLLENKGASSLDDDGLLFQCLMTIMKSYNHLYDHQRMSGAADCISSVLNAVIQSTQVKDGDGNAPLCYQVLDQFKLMLEGVYQRTGDSSIPNQNVCSTVQLLRQLDLHAIKKWVTDVQRITGNYVPLVDGMIPFMEKLKLDPGKEAEAEVEDVKGQLDAYHKSRSWSLEI